MMRHYFFTRRVLHTAATAPALAFALLAAGCARQFADPFVDAAPTDVSAVSTASAERIAAQPAPAPDRTRTHEAMPADVADGAVTHGPLWFEDPFETRGSDDGRFRWTWEDYFAIAWCDGRFLVNTIALPASAVVDPPWSAQTSDGGELPDAGSNPQESR